MTDEVGAAAALEPKPEVTFRFRPLHLVCVAALWSLGQYFAGALHAPRRTAVGVEHRLFSIPPGGVRLLESPGGGRWGLSVPQGFQSGGPPPPNAAGQSRVPAWLAPVTQRLSAFRWPGRPFHPRALSADGTPGTWLLEGDRLRRIWRYPADRWPAERYLAFDATDSYVPLPGRVLDLESRKTLRVDDLPGLQPAPDAYDLELPLPGEADAISAVRSEWNEPDPVELSATVVRGPEGVLFYLVAGSDYEEDPGASPNISEPRNLPPLFAVSTDAAPRVLTLALRVKSFAMGRDQRTVFLWRDGALWRLDLRRPILDLLHEPQ